MFPLVQPLGAQKKSGVFSRDCLMGDGRGSRNGKFWWRFWGTPTESQKNCYPSPHLPGTVRESETHRNKGKSNLWTKTILYLNTHHSNPTTKPLPQRI